MQLQEFSAQMMIRGFNKRETTNYTGRWDKNGKSITMRDGTFRSFYFIPNVQWDSSAEEVIHWLDTIIGTSGA